VLDDEPHMVFEAHSTDYQTVEALTALVEDHWAVLKVGPGLTFALREALFALAAIEEELIASADQSDDRADELAEALASALLPDDSWYANFEVAEEDVVVFANRVFRYVKGDQSARDEALVYGRAAGTPEHQLDW